MTDSVHIMVECFSLFNVSLSALHATPVMLLHISGHFRVLISLLHAWESEETMLRTLASWREVSVLSEDLQLSTTALLCKQKRGGSCWNGTISTIDWLCTRLSPLTGVQYTLKPVFP